ncbi:MAG: YfhO family protein, partial [Pseudomonadota bacterium]
FIAWARSRRWLPIAALFVTPLAFYHRLWLPDLVLIKRDAFKYFLPLKQYLVERLSAGELPQWFPYEAMGRPFIGVTNTAVLHPFTALYFLLPVHDAYRASTLLSCLLGAFGAYALGRRLEFSHAGSLLAGLAFSLSGYVVSLTDSVTYLYSICALPLFCAAWEKALVDSRAWTVAPAVVWASVFLIGDVQTGYYYGFIAVLWTAARAPKPRRAALWRLVLVGVLAALLAGIQLGPAWAVFEESDRTQPALFQEQALHWSTHPLRLVTVLASPVGEYKDLADIGRFFFDNPYRPWSVWAESLYLGIPVVGLALLGAWNRRDLRVLAILGTLALILSIGRFGGLYEVFYHVVPLWSAFRYPEKLMGIVSFAIAMLAGAGLDVLRSEKGRPRVWLVAATVCACAWFGLRTDAAGTWAAASFGAPDPLAHAVTESAAQAFLFSAGATLGVGLAVLGTRHEQFRKAWLAAVLTAIVTLDLARANFAAYHTGPLEAATFTPPLASAIAGREGTLGPGRFRLISIRGAQYLVPENMRRLLGHDAQAVEGRQALALEHNAQFHIETVYYYLPGIKAALPRNLELEAAARYNVRYYIGHQIHFRDPRFEHARLAELPEYDLALARNPVPATPRAYLSRRPERSIGPVDIKALLARPDFLSGDMDMIETTEQTLPGPSPDGVAAIAHYAPEDVRVRVETPQPAVLILLDAYDKGWTATFESGEAAPILRANALVRAVVVPAGSHTVTFRYETPLLQAGAWASASGTLLCTGLLAHAQWRRRRPQEHP